MSTAGVYLASCVPFGLAGRPVSRCGRTGHAERLAALTRGMKSSSTISRTRSSGKGLSVMSRSWRIRSNGMVKMAWGSCPGRSRRARVRGAGPPRTRAGGRPPPGEELREIVLRAYAAKIPDASRRATPARRRQPSTSGSRPESSLRPTRRTAAHRHTRKHHGRKEEGFDDRGTGAHETIRRAGGRQRPDVRRRAG